MRTAAVAASLVAVLATDLAVVRLRSMPPPLPLVGLDAAFLESQSFTRRPVPGSGPDTDPCRPDLLVAPAARPVESVRWTYAPRRALTFVTARVRRWQSEADAEAAFRLVREGVRGCFEYDVTAPNGAILVFSYVDVDGTDLGDEAVRVVSSGGFAGSGRLSRWEHQYVVRDGPYLLDVRAEELGEYDPEESEPSPCWADIFVAGLRGVRRYPCDLSRE